jgi:penicillin-binding protein 1C
MMAPFLRKMRARRVLLGLALCALAPVIALVVCASLEPLPLALRQPSQELSTQVVDRDGQMIREVRSRDGKLSSRITLSELSKVVVPALLAAEDARFYRHPGIDPIAMARAAGQALLCRKLVSGASTLTQQLARAVVVRPRTVAGKWRELALALRIEVSLSKGRILEEYLNRVEFGPNLRGIDAASRYYFDKPPAELDLAEAATLVSIPRGPTLYDPARGTRRVLLRRDRVLGRMLGQGLASADAVRIAEAEPLRLERGLTEGGTEHLVQGLVSGALAPELRGERVQRVVTTIDSGLQREVAELGRRAARDVADYGASSVSVVVVDNASGDVLAYLGSPDFFEQRALGQNDGARALRQPGSALKPFVYAAAMARLGMTPATVLPDLELRLPTPDGSYYSPKNYDGRFHGPVLLRDALQNSLNVPAVYAASRVGPERVLELLHRAGFSSLQDSAEHYGAAIALGDGEVKLTELAQAYSMLARRGEFLPLRFYRAARLASGAELSHALPSPTPVIDSRIAALLSDILSDDLARSPEFGIGGPLAFPFAVAAKTGTSKGFRDNWTVGYTHEVTVAVWAGNFDGTPMTGSTGVTGAGPLFHEVMLAVMRGRTPNSLVDHGGLVSADVCELSGVLAGASCPHRRHEWFIPGREPRATCDMHELVSLDPESGLRAGPGCRSATSQVFERYPVEYQNFARQAGRPLAPNAFSARCPGTLVASSGTPELVFPGSHAEFVIDPGLRNEQEIVLEARAASDRLTFYVDEQRLATVHAPFRMPWRLTPGTHRVRVETPSGAESELVAFDVR